MQISSHTKMPDTSEIKNMGPDGSNRKVKSDPGVCGLDVTDSVDVCGVSYSRNDNNSDYSGCGDSNDGGGGGAFLG
jgi:hypothetical protein